jgi:thioredoxin 1
MSDEITLTKANFDQEVLKSSLPVLVDFWAEWCGPCRAIGPVVAELAKEYAGKLKVGKLNVDQQAELASEFGIVSIPTLIVFKEGKAAVKKVGAMPRQAIEAMFKDLV